jgi:hypothetical protein
MARKNLTNQQILDALESSHLCPFAGHAREARILVNTICKTNWSASSINGNVWTLKTAKGFQFMTVKFPDVQGCGFDSRPISHIKQTTTTTTTTKL